MCERITVRLARLSTKRSGSTERLVHKPHVSLDKRDATEALLANTSESITQLTVEGKDLRLAVTPQTAISILNRQPHIEKPPRICQICYKQI